MWLYHQVKFWKNPHKTDKHTYTQSVVSSGMEPRTVCVSSSDKWFRLELAHVNSSCKSYASWLMRTVIPLRLTHWQWVLLWSFAEANSLMEQHYTHSPCCGCACTRVCAHSPPWRHHPHKQTYRNAGTEPWFGNLKMINSRSVISPTPPICAAETKRSLEGKCSHYTWKVTQNGLKQIKLILSDGIDSFLKVSYQ